MSKTSSLFLSFYGKIFMAHDIFPFVNVFVVTNILTRNYHEFLFYFKFVAIYYTIYENKKLKDQQEEFIVDKIGIRFKKWYSIEIPYY